MYRAFNDGEVIASYTLNGKKAVVKRKYGDGIIISLGFDYGLSYASKAIPHVPLKEKNNELYPLSLLKEWPLSPYFEMALRRAVKLERDIEIAPFENGKIVVNHRSYPYTISDKGRVYSPYGDSKIIPPHCCAFVEY